MTINTRPWLSEIKCNEDSLKLISNSNLVIIITCYVKHNFYGKSKVWNYN